MKPEINDAKPEVNFPEDFPDFFSKFIEKNRYEIRKFSKICKDDEQTLLKSLNEKDSKVEDPTNQNDELTSKLINRFYR